MQKLHLRYDQNGDIVPDSQITTLVRNMANQIVVAAGAVIDITQNAYRYDEHFVFRYTVTGLDGKPGVAFSSAAEPLEHEDFKMLVQDAVDAFEIMDMLRTQLRLKSLPLLCQASAGSPAGSARAMALSDVIRWHQAQITYLTAERLRMKQWAEENETHPGTLYDEYERRIDLHHHVIARVAEITC